MIIKATIRRRPHTGLGKSKRKFNGIIYVADKYIGKKVFVVDAKTYRKCLRTTTQFKLVAWPKEVKFPKQIKEMCRCGCGGELKDCEIGQQNHT